MGARCKGVTSLSLLFPRCSWVAADVFIYCFFRSWRCFLGEVAGNRGNFFRGAALGAAAGFVSDRGLGPGAHLPARFPRTVAAFPSALAPAKVGCRLPSLSPVKRGSGVGMLPDPFCRVPQASSPAGRWLCQAASPRLGSAGRRAGEGQTPP